jgi:hypothetical protein
MKRYRHHNFSLLIGHALRTSPYKLSMNFFFFTMATHWAEGVRAKPIVHPFFDIRFCFSFLMF